MTKVSVTTLGCRVNSYESDAMIGILRSRGFEIVNDSERADICIVNTCTVTNIADRKSRQMISRCRKNNPNAKIVVVGCWAQRCPEAASSMEGVTAVIGSSEKRRIADICTEIIGETGVKNLVSDVMHEHKFEELSAIAEGRTRAYLKIQDGCNRFCTYCAIPYARGGIRSRSIDSILREVKRLDESGYSEVVLTGIHLTDYGRDIGDVDLADAIDCFNGFNNIKRIRLGSLEPHGLNDRMIERITSNTRVCRQFHLSLQSGSSSVLERMRRGYSAEEYAETVQKIRTRYGSAGDKVAVTTDIIAGFPGETDEEHSETIRFMKRIGFARVHVFPFSRRSGTLADKMPGQLTNAEKADRAQELISVGKELERSFLEKFIGSKESVLIETEKADGRSFGFTDSYVRVLCPKAEPNMIIEVDIKSIQEDKNGELSLLSDC